MVSRAAVAASSMITWATRCSAGDSEGNRPRARTVVGERSRPRRLGGGRGALRLRPVMQKLPLPRVMVRCDPVRSSDYEPNVGGGRRRGRHVHPVRGGDARRRRGGPGRGRRREPQQQRRSSWPRRCGAALGRGSASADAAARAARACSAPPGRPARAAQAFRAAATEAWARRRADRRGGHGHRSRGGVRRRHRRARRRAAARRHRRAGRPVRRRRARCAAATATAGCSATRARRSGSACGRCAPCWPRWTAAASRPSLVERACARLGVERRRSRDRERGLAQDAARGRVRRPAGGARPAGARGERRRRRRATRWRGGSAPRPPTRLLHTFDSVAPPPGAAGGAGRLGAALARAGRPRRSAPASARPDRRRAPRGARRRRRGGRAGRRPAHRRSGAGARPRAADRRRSRAGPRVEQVPAAPRVERGQFAGPGADHLVGGRARVDHRAQPASSR